MLLDVSSLHQRHPLLPLATASEYVHRAAMGLQRAGHEPGCQVDLEIDETMDRFSNPGSLKMTLDELNLLVSQAIRRAELLDELGAPTVKEAWTEVSLIEEQLALRQEASTAGGYFARRGAVNAAFKAGNLDRAEMLMEYFDKEGSASGESLAQFR